MIRLGERNQSPVSSLILDRVTASIDFLSQLIDPETGEQRELLQSAEQSIRNPRLSPDRKWIAFDASRPGMYGGTGVFLLESLDIPARRDQAIYAGFSVLAGIAVIVVAFFMERVCKLPEDDDEAGNGNAAHAA